MKTLLGVIVLLFAGATITTLAQLGQLKAENKRLQELNNQYVGGLLGGAKGKKGGYLIIIGDDRITVRNCQVDQWTQEKEVE